jgi:uncharacterized delta-60 repeat protein
MKAFGNHRCKWHVTVSLFSLWFGVGLALGYWAPTGQAQTINLTEFFALQPGNQWMYGGITRSGNNAYFCITVEATNRQEVFFTNRNPSATFSNSVISLLVQAGYWGGPGSQFYSIDDRYDYLTRDSSGWRQWGFDDDRDVVEIRYDTGLGLPMQVAIGQAYTNKAACFSNGVYWGQASLVSEVLGWETTAVPLWVFSDNLHLRFSLSMDGAGVQAWEEWWAKGVGQVKLAGISGNTAAEYRELQTVNFDFPLPPMVTASPAGQVPDRGASVTLEVTAAGSPPFSYQWFKDGAGLPQGTNQTLVLTNFQVADTGDYWVVVNNGYGTGTSGVATLEINFAVVETNFNASVNTTVRTMLLQPDGKILVGGDYSHSSSQFPLNLERFNADGTADITFNLGVERADGRVSAFALQPDGKMVVAGAFSRLGGKYRNNLGRLNSDATVDASFNPGTDGSVSALVLQPDGKILVGGSFQTIGGLTNRYLGRLNTDGTLDRSFNPGWQMPVSALAMQPDGKIIVGVGSAAGTNAFQRLGRINADGSLDTSFSNTNSFVCYSLALRNDGKIWIGGSSFMVNPPLQSYLYRMNADGTMDATFNLVADYDVNAIMEQTDGTLLLGGVFNTLGGQSHRGLGRLNPDSTLDYDYRVGVVAAHCLIGQPDGKILVGGAFSSIGGQHHNSFARIGALEPATQSLTFDGAVITWLRGGNSPEVWRTTFEYTTNGIDWCSLGAGTRTNGGWVFAGAAVPLQSVIRAHGYVTGNNSVVETLAGAPLVVATGTNLTTIAGADAVFPTRVLGSGQIFYQWFKNGVTLLDGGNITGANGPSLTVRNLLVADAGTYSVVASNELGNVTSVVAVVSVLDPGISVQPITQYRAFGNTVVFQVTASGTAPLTYQWYHGGMRLPDAADSRLVLTNIQQGDLGDYFVVVTNAAGSVTSAVVALHVDLLALDAGFNPCASNAVYALAVQPDGRMVVGGVFTNFNGQVRQRLARLNADGSLDTGFTAAANDIVQCVALQPDGKILVGGDFQTVSGQPRQCLARLNPDGTLDNVFAPNFASTNSTTPHVYAIALQEDGKVVVGGSFNSLNGQAVGSMARLNPDGTIETNFHPMVSGEVLSLALQADGNILVGGNFDAVDSYPRTRLARVDQTGNVDGGFNPLVEWGSVYSLAVQPDGKVLLGGNFWKLNSSDVRGFGRLLRNGNNDVTYTAVLDDRVGTIGIQTDGGIFAGLFRVENGIYHRTGVIRLNPDGSLDPNCSFPNYYSINSLAITENGNITVGGNAYPLSFSPSNHIARLINNSPATQKLTFDGASINWLRGGTSPEVWRTTFEYSTNGTTWFALGTGIRTNAGWFLSGISLPSNSVIRARGFVCGNGSIVETTTSVPVIEADPASQTTGARTCVTFKANAVGPDVLTYQWWKDGISLTDGGDVTGANSNRLTVCNLLRASEGQYYLVVSNTYGSVTSTVANLTVHDPWISMQPFSQTVTNGGEANLRVVASGTTPLAYQWYFESQPISGATSSLLAITNLHDGGLGAYTVVVSNQFGTVTSMAALLGTNTPAFDVSFAPVPDGAANFARQVTLLAIQPDGKLLVCGGFTSLCGVPRNAFGRLNPDGTLDVDFAPEPNGQVNALVVQPDGKIVVGGDFTSICGQGRPNLARLNPDGSLDVSFALNASNRIRSLALQKNGMVLVGGDFTALGGKTCKYLGRLYPDGTLDATFQPDVYLEGFPAPMVETLAVQPDGKILVGGRFSSVGRQPRYNFGRLNADGTLDAEFQANALKEMDFLTAVYAIAFQADGNILVGGRYTNLCGEARTYLGRVNPDGILDPGFAPVLAGTVTSIALQTDGKILLCGGLPTRSIGRLNADGSSDMNSDVKSDFSVTCFALQEDGNMAAGLYFLNHYQPLRNLARLLNTYPATQSLSNHGTNVIWLRGGASPEVWRTTFEYTTDGVNWISLGTGSRINGGWAVAGFDIPTNSVVRTRGFVTGNGSVVGSVLDPSGLLEAVRPRFLSRGIASLPGGGLQLGITNGPGMVLEIQGRTNLSLGTWETLGRSSNGLPFTDPAANLPQRFYRLRQVTP